MRTFIPLIIGSMLVVGVGLHAEPTIHRSADLPIQISPAPSPKPGPDRPAAQKDEPSQKKDGTTSAGQPEYRAREARPASEGLSFKPAPEVVELTCPHLIHHVGRLEENAPELRAWKAEPVKPGVVRTELRFHGFQDDFWGTNWQGASSIVCSYSTRGEGAPYTQQLTRKIHPSGTPYQCKVKPRGSRTVECRLSITPDF